MLEALVLDGTVTVLAIAVLTLEVAALFTISRTRAIAGRFVANALSGLCLIIALRASLVGSGATAIAIWLGLGFLAHLADLAQRLRR